MCLKRRQKAKTRRRLELSAPAIPTSPDRAMNTPMTIMTTSAVLSRLNNAYTPRITITAAIIMPAMPMLDAPRSRMMPMTRSITARINMRRSENRLGATTKATPMTNPMAPMAMPGTLEDLICTAMKNKEVKAIRAPAIIRTMFNAPLPPTAKSTPTTKIVRLATNLIFHGFSSMTVTLLIGPSRPIPNT